MNGIKQPNEARKRNMSAIKSQNTKPEILVRSYLHKKGFRFRLHDSKLPGCPDLVLKKYNLVIFVHGCFWHRHENCFYSSTPKENFEFWNEKFKYNILRDKAVLKSLQQSGWRTMVIWECGLKIKYKSIDELIPSIVGDQKFIEWPTKPPRAC